MTPFSESPITALIPAPTPAILAVKCKWSARLKCHTRQRLVSRHNFWRVGYGRVSAFADIGRGRRTRAAIFKERQFRAGRLRVTARAFRHASRKIRRIDDDIRVRRHARADSARWLTVAVRCVRSVAAFHHHAATALSYPIEARRRAASMKLSSQSRI